MASISSALSADHQRCDAAFADMESAVAEQDWERAVGLFASFDEDMRRHLDFEEQVLFPLLENEPGLPAGPTMVMRTEHEEMRALLDEMQENVGGRSADDFLGQAETLLILLQQHNVKEEQVLYAMADAMLPPERVAEVVGQLEQWGVPAR